MGCGSSSETQPTGAPVSRGAVVVPPLSRRSTTAHSRDHSAKWAVLREKLPRNRTQVDQERRVKLFREFDPNNSGFLSCEECAKGCKDVLHLDSLTTTLPILVNRAFAGTITRRTQDNTAHDPHRIDTADFRLFLVYLYDYFEMWVMFDELDLNDDSTLSLAEFKKGVPTIEGWGVEIADPAAAFEGIDQNGGGTITFAEFCHWAIQQHLDADGTAQQVVAE